MPAFRDHIESNAKNFRTDLLCKVLAEEVTTPYAFLLLEMRTHKNKHGASTKRYAIECKSQESA